MFYVLECRAEQCTAEFYINDIPVIRRGPDIGDAFGGPVNFFMVDGVNTLDILVHPGPTPAEAVSGPGGNRYRMVPEKGAAASAALAAYPKGAVLEGPDREEIVSVEWKAGEGACVFPTTKGVRIDLGDLYGRWKWQDAEPLDPDAGAFDEARDFVIGIHSSLAIGDFDRYVDLGVSRSEEADRAYGKPAGATAGTLRGMKAYCADDPAWGLQMLNPDEFSFRLCGENRVVDCLSKTWKPVLEELPDMEGSVSRYPIMISRIDGEWEIVR